MIVHPVAEGEVIEYMQPVCKCSGARFKISEGKIKKVHKRVTGKWCYQLYTGVIVEEIHVREIME